LTKLASILFLLIFGVYSFTFKTHYCYNKDGSRFHGNCKIHATNAHLASLLSTTFQPQEFECHNVQLEKQYQQANYYNNFETGVFILPATIKLPLVVAMSESLAIPMFSCRGGPPSPTLSLRGPPLG
jgi:hypothetical protein